MTLSGSSKTAIKSDSEGLRDEMGQSSLPRYHAHGEPHLDLIKNASISQVLNKNLCSSVKVSHLSTKRSEPRRTKGANLIGPTLSGQISSDSQLLLVQTD